MLHSTSKYVVDRILYQDGEFAVALGRWDGEPGLRVACRWYEEDGIGYPQTFGKPQWMLLPSSAEVDLLGLTDPASSVRLTFRRVRGSGRSCRPESDVIA